MDDLRTILDSLENAELEYVMARTGTRTNAEALRQAGISHSSFYAWPEETRDRLHDLAQQMKRETVLRAQRLLEESVEQAAQVKVKGLASRKEHIKQSAATEILDRVVGKSAQPVVVDGEISLTHISIREYLDEQDD